MQLVVSAQTSELAIVIEAQQKNDDLSHCRFLKIGIAPFRAVALTATRV